MPNLPVQPLSHIPVTMNEIKRSRLVRALRVVLLNVTLLVFFVVLGAILVPLQARFFGEPAYGGPVAQHCAPGSAHYELSLQQKELLGEDGTDLQAYCESIDSVPPEDWARRTYWDYHYYSTSEISSETVNFESTDLFNARRVPCSSDAADAKVVWLFGGSTMQNLETSDEGTIANALCEELKRALGVEVRVLNLGVGSFVAEMEIAKFVALFKRTLDRPELRPDVAIFYDGYNDSVRLNVFRQWYGLPEDYGQKFSFIYSVAPSGWKAGYWVVRAMREGSQAIADHNGNAVSDVLMALEARLLARATEGASSPQTATDLTPQTRALLSKAFVFDQTELASVCEGLDIKCFTALQPLLVLRDEPKGAIEASNLQNFEASEMAADTRDFYVEVMYAAPSLRNCFYKLVDLSDFTATPPFDQIPHFYDFGHTGFYSGAMIGKFLGERIAGHLMERGETSCPSL